MAISGEEKALDKLLPSTNFSRLPSRRKPLGQVGKTFQENVKDKILIFSEVEADLLNDVVQKSLQPLRLILDVA